MPNQMVKEALESTNWDAQPDVRPGCIQYGGKGADVKYFRFSNDNGVEPLVIERHFHGLKPGSLEILEEFRLFHNLYFDSAKGAFVMIDDAGNEHDVIQISDQEVKIRVKELRQFLAFKEMHLALFFDHRYNSAVPIEKLGIDSKEREKEVRNNLTHYTLIVARSMTSRGESFSRLLGKKFIPGLPKEKTGIWPYDNSDNVENFENFIVGIDADGNQITRSCDPHGGDYLAPVFFKKEVLAKYYNAPTKYSVEDGYLRCGGLWGIAIDNDHPEYVMVYLGDLGRDLPEPERSYWKHFNVAHSGPQSKTSFSRNMLAEFADPEQPDLTFKAEFSSFGQDWTTKFGWPLFKPLTKDDAHCLSSLRIPLSEEQLEFDQQVQNLTKVLVDSLNDAELERGLSLPPNTKSIGKLEPFLKQAGVPGSDPHIKFLRDLQELRSASVAHRKGSNYSKVMQKFGLDKTPKTKVFRGLLINAKDLLAHLRKHLL
jgi:hypothetical protein